MAGHEDFFQRAPGPFPIKTVLLDLKATLHYQFKQSFTHLSNLPGTAVSRVS